MKKNILPKIMIPAAVLFTPNAVYAAEAWEATSEQLAVMKRINNQAAFESKKHKEDWENIQKLIDRKHAKVLIQPIQYQPGSCVYGLDGFPQILDPKYKDPRSENGSIELSEMIMNYDVRGKTNQNGKFFFPCNLTAETPQKTDDEVTVPISIVEVPKVMEKEVPSGKFSAGVGYMHLVASPDEVYKFDGQLHGGKALVTFQPRGSNWYFGPEAMVFGNRASAVQDINVPATDGPLTGELVMRGKNEYSLHTLGIGLGFVGGYQFLNKNNAGMGLELSSGVMHDWVTRELTETSAHYVNGNLLEGTNISNTSSDAESQVNVYNALGLRLKLSPVCVIPYGGIRTDFSQINPLGGVSVGYCPK